MDLVLETMRRVSQVIYEPMYIAILLILGFNLYTRNKRVSTVQKFILGSSIDSPKILTLSQLLFGAIAGVIGSLILSQLGIMFTQGSGIEYLLMISVIMMFFNPRFICFSYSGAIVGILSIIFNDLLVNVFNVHMPVKFLNIDITALIALVGVMHFIEGLLVLVDGKKGMLPVFTNDNGKIKGGFMFRRFWALPIALMLIVASSNEIFDAATVSLDTPTWWPVIMSNETSKLLGAGAIAFLGIYFILSYQAVTFTTTPKKKIVKSGISIVIYGLLMIIVSPLAQYNIFTKLIMLIIMPLVHELILGVQNRKEHKGTPIYISDDKGLMVLYVVNDSIAYTSGIESRDKILELNGEILEDEEQIRNSIVNRMSYIKLKVLKHTGEEKIIEITNVNNGSELGLLLVPNKMPKENQVLNYSNNF